MLNKSSARAASSPRTVCGVANPRHGIDHGCGLRLASHSDPRRSPSPGLIQHCQGLWRSLILGLAAALALGLAGCGFQLRQTTDFAFKSLYLDVPPTSALGVELKRHLAANQVELITEAAQRPRAQAILDILDEQRVKTVVGVSATGQVREFNLRLQLKFRLRTPQGKELIPETELVQQRALTYDEVYALAKESEELMLYRNMQSDIVQQILRRMAAVKSL